MHGCNDFSTSSYSTGLDMLFKRRENFIYKIIRHHLKGSPGAEDIFQNTFVRFLEKPRPLEQIDSEPYLYRVVTNNTKNYRKNNNSHRARALKYGWQKSTSDSKEHDPLKDVIRRDESSYLWRLMEMVLPVQIVDAFKLSLKENLDNAEIGKRLGIQQKTVNSYFSIGIKTLKQHVAKIKHDREEHRNNPSKE